MQNMELLRSLVSQNALFESFSDEQLSHLLTIMEEERTLQNGEFLVKEGDEADNLYIVKDGSFEVVKKEINSDKVHRIAVVETGKSIGEVALLDKGPRSASICSIGQSTVLVFPIEAIEAMSSATPTLDVKMKINLAYEMGSRLRSTNESTVKSLREMLDESEKRTEMGRFISQVLIGVCLYMFALGALKDLAQYLPDTTIVTVPILLSFAIALAFLIRFSPFPASAYGFTTKNWKVATKEAILFSLPVVAIIIFAKWMLVLNLPSLKGAPIFDFYQSKGVSVTTMIFSIIAYSIFAPIQEMISRSGMQASFQMFLTGKNKTIISVVVSTLLFSATHLHVSMTLALLVFPLGLFWGWLFSRNTTLIGVCVSHIALGLFGLFIVGFPTRS